MQRVSKTWIALLIAEFFYCGRSPIAPGTVGSLASLVIWVPAIYFAWPVFVKLSLVVALFFLGLWASSYGIRYYGNIDPKQIVIDEVVGQGIPFLLISSMGLEILFAFLLFRFFDIVKPWPIKSIERDFPNHWGLMLDDVAAGICALFILFLCMSFLPSGMLFNRM
jgi:phosphatidylglycerophosphatase A